MRATLALLVGVVLAISGLGYLYSRSLTHIGVLETHLAAQTARTERSDKALKRAQERFKSERQVLVARQAQNASEARKFDMAQEALQTALQAEKEWNDTEVPPAVREALLGPSGGRHGDSGGPDSDGLRNAPEP